MTEVGFAIGNGMSREGWDLEQLRGHGTIVGCNWLYRDFSPDIIVALDAEPRREIAKIPYPEQRTWKWMTWEKNKAHLQLEGERAFPVIEINRRTGKNSGIVAVSYLSKKLRCDKVYLVGFDFFRIHPGDKQNDIYHSMCLCRYRKFDLVFNQLFNDCPHTEFTRVGPVHPLDEKCFAAMNCDFIDFPEFERRLKSGLL